MIASFLSQFGAYFIGAFGIIAAFLIHGNAQKKIGKAQAEVSAANATSQEHEAIAVRQINEERAASETSTEAVRKANEAIQSVNRGNAGDADIELRNKWSRD